MADFSVDVDAWLMKSERRIRSVLRQSVQDVMEVAQTPRAKGGRMPIVTGTLRRSLQSSLNGGTALTGPTSYTMIANQIEPGDEATFGWTANYARAVNSGQGSFGGYHFVEGAAETWEPTVKRNTAMAKRLFP